MVLVLKNGGDVSAFRKELDRAVGERAEISALVSTRSFEIRDLNKMVEKEEVVSALCLALGRTTCDGSCTLFARFGEVKCRIREHVEVSRCFRCLGYGHRSRGCSNPDRKDACWRCGTTGHLDRN